jgi:hypothetical protein
MQIAFFPWLFLKEAVTLGPLTFQNFRDQRGVTSPSLAELGGSLDKILQGYVDMRGRPVGICVLVTHASRTPAWDLADEDHELVARYANILFLCGMAKNDYNTNMGCYTNASTFQFVRQRFAAPVEFIAFSTRRRDGSTMDGGYRHGDVKFPIPPQSKSVRDTCIDTTLAHALAAAIDANSHAAQRVLAALVFFSLANTDSDVMQQEAEVILMGSAYEQLLDVEASARALNAAIGKLLSPYASIKVAEALKHRPGIVIEQKYEAAQQTWPVHRKWAQEFYQLRNDYTHGNDVGARTWGWQPLEHLVMAAFLFPVIVKVLLSKEGYYQLTEDDEGALRAIDKLLIVNRWGQRVGSHSNATAWQETFRKSIHNLAMHRAIEKGIAELRAQGIFPPQGVDDGKDEE